MEPKTDTPSDFLSSFQKNHLLSICSHVDRLLTDIETILAVSATPSPFQKYSNDVSPAQRKVLLDYLARIRAQMVRALESQNTSPEPHQIGAIHAIRTTLMFAEIAIEELEPKYMRGYGEVREAAIPGLHGIVIELKGLLQKLSSYLARGLGHDLQGRLGRLERTNDEVELLKVIEQIITERGMVEFRPAVSMIVDSLERRSFEIALFGRVSSGKSSLLNHILQEEVLPVGVNPITAVPTRIVFGPRTQLTVWFADREAERLEITRLFEFAAEGENPSNSKHVTRLVVELPSHRLSSGVAFVDTPGLGSLASTGAAETLAYLPQCDLGVVLIDAGSTLSQEDLSTIQALYESGIPAFVLLSKADLLGPEDRTRSMAYIAEHIRSELGLTLSVHPVSIMKDHAKLLDRWFEQEISPLFDRHQELARQSIRRKIGSLREAVATALRLKLERVGKRPQGGQSKPREIEAELRAAVGKFEEARIICEERTEELRTSVDSALARFAAAIVAQWPRKDLQPRPLGDLGVSILTSVAAETASTVREALEILARLLAKALHSTATALGSEEVLMEDELTTAIREMPRLDLGLPQLDIRRPTLMRSLGTRWAERQVKSQLYDQIGPVVSEGVSSYSRTLAAWARRTLTEIQRRFDAHADAYRAQLEQLTGEKSISLEEQDALRLDLESLTHWDGGAESAGIIPDDREATVP